MRPNFKRDKFKKEESRKKKQEEKRNKRLHKKDVPGQNANTPMNVDGVTATNDLPEVQTS